jgi:hypothetical protein
MQKSATATRPTPRLRPLEKVPVMSPLVSTLSAKNVRAEPVLVDEGDAGGAREPRDAVHPGAARRDGRAEVEAERLRTPRVEGVEGRGLGDNSSTRARQMTRSCSTCTSATHGVWSRHCVM